MPWNTVLDNVQQKLSYFTPVHYINIWYFILFYPGIHKRLQNSGGEYEASSIEVLYQHTKKLLDSIVIWIYTV